MTPPAPPPLNRAKRLALIRKIHRKQLAIIRASERSDDEPRSRRRGLELLAGDVEVADLLPRDHEPDETQEIDFDVY